MTLYSSVIICNQCFGFVPNVSCYLWFYDYWWIYLNNHNIHLTKNKVKKKSKTAKESAHVLIFLVNVFTISGLTNLLTCFSIKPVSEYRFFKGQMMWSPLNRNCICTSWEYPLFPTQQKTKNIIIIILFLCLTSEGLPFSSLCSRKKTTFCFGFLCLLNNKVYHKVQSKDQFNTQCTGVILMLRRWYSTIPYKWTGLYH